MGLDDDAINYVDLLQGHNDEAIGISGGKVVVRKAGLQNEHGWLCKRKRRGDGVSVGQVRASDERNTYQGREDKEDPTMREFQTAYDDTQSSGTLLGEYTDDDNDEGVQPNNVANDKDTATEQPGRSGVFEDEVTSLYDVQSVGD